MAKYQINIVNLSLDITKKLKRRMTLHIFNPEHDLAMACNMTNFTAPHAARRLRSGLGFIPALWANPGDSVLVEDAVYAAKAYKKLTRKDFCKPIDITFVEEQDLESLPINNIEPWGWDPAIRNSLIRQGVSKDLMPSLEQIDNIRMLSHRSLAKELLDELRKLPNTIGQAFVCKTIDEIAEKVEAYGQVIVKAPWSSSGRGLRFVEYSIEEPHIHGWLKNMLKAQGCLMVEPYLRKVKDFGMEFYSDGEGHISYCGLSLFQTENGAYIGNILATEHAKEEMISRYISAQLMDAVKTEVQAYLGERLKGLYRGPFGIDMMIVPREDKDGFMIDPCVEINLRRTMGHVALELSPTDDDIKRVMRIVIEDNYQLKIKTL